MTSVSKILKNLDTENGISLNILEKSLKLTKRQDKDNLSIGIRALKKLGIIKTKDNDLLILNADHNFISAKIRCSSKGYCFAVRDDEGEDIYIRETSLNNALHGDSVMIKITKEGLRRRAPEGSVQCVLHRCNNNILAKLEQNDSNGELLASPLDDRISANINLLNTNISHSSLTENIFELKINKYPIGQFIADATVTRELPLNAGIKGDIDIILAKNNITKDISIPRISPKKVLEKKREDLTNQPSLLFKSWESINSPSLPAIYAEPYEGGTRLWIHTPTVAERINIGGKLDEYLKERGEAICLGNDWIEFLNESLEKKSSFKLDEESEAISIMFDIDNNGNICDWKFSLSKIKPFNIITTKHLETINKRKRTSKSIPVSIKAIKDSLEIIYTIIHVTNIINEKHINDGSIQLELGIPKLDRLSELHKTYPSRDFYGWHKALDINDPQSIMNVLIRTTNNILYRHLNAFKLPYIYKEDEDIDPSSINELTKSALALDTNIKLNSDGYATTTQLLRSFNSSSDKKILHKLFKHIVPGINLKLYAHKTDPEVNSSQESNEPQKTEAPWCCPTLNYWNIFNQYILFTLLSEGKKRPNSKSRLSIDLGEKNSWENIEWEIFTNKTKQTLDNIASKTLVQHLNEIRTRSKSFRNNIISIAQAREAQKIIGKEVEAVITGVQSYGFFAEIQELPAEGLVHVSTLGDDWYEYRSRQNLLVGRKNKKTYQLAQIVNVRVLKIDLLKNQIDLELVNTYQREKQNDNETTSNTFNKD